jgi:aminoglycoside phosphotransferase family enzyme/predicted kinase
MVTEDQSGVIDFLGSPATHGGETVERIETHASIVFLAGDRAYKLKRAVRFDYLDFSTPSRRHMFCEAELRLNQRTAPTLYRRVVAITRSHDGSYALAGDGEPVDWVVEMNRFSQDVLFDRLAALDRLDLELMPPLAVEIARFHQSANRRPDHGGERGISSVIQGNAAGFAEYGSGCLAPGTSSRVIDESYRELERRASLLERRREAGFIRECHGDLHLRNIVLVDGRPTLFDGIEFNDELSCTDVFYDFAFLVMDLWRRKLPRHANAVFNRYLAETNDLEALPLLPLFLSCRAAVRAKTSATAGQLQDAGARQSELGLMALEYLEMAEQLLQPSRPALIAVGGLSGSGKSTLALGLAPLLGRVPGAVVLRSDEIRKRLCGVSILEPLGADGYSSQMSERVYAVLAERAAAIVTAGHSAIADAVYAREADRRTIEGIAIAASVPFVGLWLDAPDSVLVARTARRRNDPSDADAHVIRMQRGRDYGQISWHRVDASQSAASVLRCGTDLMRTDSRHPLIAASAQP